MKINGVLLDLSGTLYQGREMIPGALEAIAELLRSGLPIRYVTNSSRVPANTLWEKLKKLGFAIDPDEIFTAPQAVKQYLAEQQLRPYLLIHPELEVEFADLDQERPDTVVVADAAEAFSYTSLNQAFRLLLDGAPLVAVGDNRYFRDDHGMSLDAGPFIRALEYAAGCQAIYLGKPAPAFFLAALSDFGCHPEEVLMVGDDVFADVNGALEAGLQGALVKTGKFRVGDEQHLCGDAMVCPDLWHVVTNILD
jgi:HAD superfamily hydrolase (TIGR01458 family)